MVSKRSLQKTSSRPTNPKISNGGPAWTPKGGERPGFRFWVTPSLSPTENLVRGWCQVRGGKEGICRDSLRSMGKNLKMNPNTVREALRRLEEEGYLKPVPGGGWSVPRVPIKGMTVFIPDGLMRAPISPSWKIVLGRKRDAGKEIGWSLGKKALARQLGIPPSTVQRALAWQKNLGKGQGVLETDPRSTKASKGVLEADPRSTGPSRTRNGPLGVPETDPPRTRNGPLSVLEADPRSTLGSTFEKQQKADPYSTAWRRTLSKDPIKATQAVLSACGFDSSQKKTFRGLASRWVQAGRTPGQALTLGLKALDKGKNPGAFLRSLVEDALKHPEEKILSTPCGQELRDQEAFQEQERLRLEKEKASWYGLSVPEYRAYDRARKIRERLRGPFTPEEVVQEFGLSSPQEARELAEWATRMEQRPMEESSSSEPEASNAPTGIGPWRFDDVVLERELNRLQTALQRLKSKPNPEWDCWETEVDKALAAIFDSAELVGIN